MILQPFYPLDINIRYVSANINMESSKIIENISLKLICEEELKRPANYTELATSSNNPLQWKCEH